jgi:hypothetical protein
MRTEPDSGRQVVLAWLAALFAIPVPLATVAVFGRQVARTGNVSHWPWEEYGVFGWWLVPLSLWVAAACAMVRGRRSLADVPTKVVMGLATITSLALLYNP